MREDKFGQQIYDEDDIIDLYYKNPDINFRQMLTERSVDIPDVLNLQKIPYFVPYVNIDETLESFDKGKQKNWHMPDDYKDLDIVKYVLDKCQTEQELQRVGEELLLYVERDMLDLLRYLKFLVDVMRKNNVVWGVGRGSSVASYVLFLIGIHRINSIYYDLSIKEFLK